MGKTTDVKDTFVSFTSETSLHGVGKILKPKEKPIQRVIWCVLTLGTTGCFLYFFVAGIQRYAQRPTTTKSGLESSTALPFPAVTICNNNQILASFIKGYPDIEKLMQDISFNFRKIDPNPVNVSEPGFEAQLKNFTQVEFYAQGGHKLPNMFIQCNWERVEFDCGLIVTPVITDIGGLCYTFNYDGVINSRRDGYQYGLYIIINIEQEEYSHIAMVPGAGVKVMLHKPNTLPSFKSDALSVGPGVAADIQVKEVKTERLPHPYEGAGCYSGNDYLTLDQCLMNCQLAHVSGGCDCVMPFGYREGISIRVNTSRSCTLYDLYHCGIIKLVEFFEDESLVTQCNCLHHCQETTYESQISSMLYPSDFALNYYNNELKLNRTKAFFRENILYLRIYYGNLLTKIVTQTPSYTFANFAAEIGGYLGLFLGASLLTMSEILEFITKTMTVLFKCRNSK